MKWDKETNGGRTCGGCTACCTTLGIVELRKPTKSKCEHECAAGCAIYGNRPKECEQWACGWLAGLVGGDERYRPSNLGVMFDLDDDKGTDPITGGRIGVCLVVYEIVEGRLQDQKVKYLIQKILKRFSKPTVIYYPLNAGPLGMPFKIDGTKYPTDSEFKRHEYRYSNANGRSRSVYFVGNQSDHYSTSA